MPNYEFEHNGVRFSITHLPGMDRLQLQVWASDLVGWEVVHGKDIPEGMTPATAAELMRLFAVGAITPDEYHRQLPGG